MCVVCSVSYGAAGVGLLVATANAPLATLSASSSKNITTITTLQELPASVEKIGAPQLEEPEWLKKQNAEEAARNQALSRPVSQTVTYSVASRGNVGNLDEFRAQANQTLNDSRGWSRLGVRFQEVESGGRFILMLSTADQMTSFSSGCSPEWSCRVGPYVIINQDRWTGASAAWNQAGGSLRDYRHSVINHEIGHWLGHDHTNCGGAGQPAKIMQQQSISLQGCKISSWPQEDELWSTTLGIGR